SNHYKYFFFQAEDGIRDFHVTGVQTCALPIFDVRIIAATHRNLRAQVEDGRFREDLFYRLSNFPIELPALRERGEDILRLARHFADKGCAFLQRDLCRWSDAALELLASYAFPGNVRELKAMVRSEEHTSELQSR